MAPDLTAEEWTAIASWASALILLVTGIYVALQLREAKNMRREQFRPWITVSFHFRSNMAFAAIRNIGTTAARDVGLRFDPPLESTLAAARPELQKLSAPITVLCPGEERLALLDRVPDRLQSDLPTAHLVTVSYRDHRSGALPVERFVLDFEPLVAWRLADKNLNDLVGEVAAIRKLIEAGEEPPRAANA